MCDPESPVIELLVDDSDAIWSLEQRRARFPLNKFSQLWFGIDGTRIVARSLLQQVADDLRDQHEINVRWRKSERADMVFQVRHSKQTPVNGVMTSVVMPISVQAQRPMLDKELRAVQETLIAHNIGAVVGVDGSVYVVRSYGSEQYRELYRNEQPGHDTRIMVTRTVETLIAQGVDPMVATHPDAVRWLRATRLNDAEAVLDVMAAVDLNSTRSVAGQLIDAYRSVS